MAEPLERGQAIPAFAGLLRANGLPVGSGQLLDLCRALPHIDITNRDLFYFTARALLLSRHADEPLFASLFARFWLAHPSQTATSLGSPFAPLPSKPQEQAAAGDEENDSDAVPALRLLLDVGGAEDPQDQQEDPGAQRDQVATFSASELLRHKDFGDLSPHELSEVRRLIADLRWRAATRKLRRTRRATSGPHLDPRRALRENLSHGGEILTLPRRTPRRKPRPLVLICDISGSMARYTGLLLRFLHALRQGRGGVETFVFGTRLTRITRQLRTRDTEQALAEVAGEVLDWGGGTRIGDSLSAFNRVWGRRVLGHDATVVIISDGWDRGEPLILSAEMAHLQRLAHRLVWLNPLLGLTGYEPLTRGMRAALPHIDDFLSAHNLASLEMLARFLERLDERRPERGHGSAPVAVS